MLTTCKRWPLSTNVDIRVGYDNRLRRRVEEYGMSWTLMGPTCRHVSLKLMEQNMAEGFLKKRGITHYFVDAPRRIRHFVH